MPENKKHHYVPRFLLKRFSTDGKSINLWNIKSKRKIISANLKNQCYKDYFYGRTNTIEKSLGDIEGQTAELLRKLDEIGYPPPPGSDEYIGFLLFTLLQEGRTVYAVEAMEEFIDRFYKHAFVERVAAEGIDIEDYTVGLRDPAAYAAGVNLRSYPVALDLDIKLLKNKTKSQFIISDNPVVLYNQLFRFRNYGSNTGFACKGLQIFIPVSPSQILMFFDSDVYGVGPNQKSYVEITQEKDVHQLNMLQMCSAYQNAYFENSSENIEALSKKAEPFRRTTKTQMDVFPEPHAQERRRELVVSSREDIRCNFAVSFIRLRKSAKSWRREFLKKRQQPAVVLRNEELASAAREFTKEVEEGSYEPADFLTFWEKYTA